MTTTDIEIAQTTIQTLSDKKNAATQRASEIAAERQALGYAAHVDNDAKARAKLAKLNAEQASLIGEVESIDAAIAEGRTRLAAAITAAELAQARADAKEVRAICKTLLAAAADIDSSLEDFVASTYELQDAVNKLHQLGCRFPNHAQIESLGTRVVLTAIGQSIFKRAVETLAPGERRSFVPLAATWIKTIEDAHIKPLLGEQTSNEKAA